MHLPVYKPVTKLQNTTIGVKDMRVPNGYLSGSCLVIGADVARAAVHNLINVEDANCKFHNTAVSKGLII